MEIFIRTSTLIFVKRARFACDLCY